MLFQRLLLVFCTLVAFAGTVRGMIPGANEPRQSYYLTHTDGIEVRNGQPCLMVYHARMYPASANNWWIIPPIDERLPLELCPSSRDGKLTVRALWQGHVQAGTEITADLAGGKRIEGRANGDGDFSVPAGEPGVYTFRTKQSEKAAGDRDSKKYASILHNYTLVVIVGGDRPSQVTLRKVTGRLFPGSCIACAVRATRR